MPDKKLLREILLQIDKAVATIKYRFEPITKIDDLTDTPEGQEKLDGLCMLFIAIGESLKNVDKITDRELLKKYDHIDWRAIKGMRDILSHHYFDLNAEAVFNVCNEDIDALHSTIKQILNEL